MIPPCRTLQSQTIFSLPYENTGSESLFMSRFPPVGFSQKNNDQDAWEFSLSWQCSHIHLYSAVSPVPFLKSVLKASFDFKTIKKKKDFFPSALTMLEVTKV